MPDDSPTIAPERSWLRLPEPSHPPPQVAAVFAATEAKLGYVRHAQRVVAHKPAHLVAQQAYSDALMLDPESRLSRCERELIALVVSAENRCDVCVWAHAAQLRQLSGNPEWVAQLEVNYRRAALSPRERALAEYALATTLAPAGIEPDDLDKLRVAGLDEIAILEAAEIAAYFNLSNRIMCALGIVPNREAYVAHR